MNALHFGDDTHLGAIVSVDTDTAAIRLRDPDGLRGLQINRLIAVESSRPGEFLIGLIRKITRALDEAERTIEKPDVFAPASFVDLVRVALIGTMRARVGLRSNVFGRSVDTVPEVGALAWTLEGAALAAFMNTIGRETGTDARIHLGHYAIDPDAEAYVDGDRFFQRHALIVGSTGSGKSTTVARLIEQASALPNADMILFDIHGEYGPLSGDAIRHLRIAAPGDETKGLADGVLHLPFWLLGYEAVIALFIDRSDQNAPNQAMLVSTTIRELKEKHLRDHGRADLADRFTTDSPVPFDVGDLLSKLTYLNEERVAGAKAGTDKAGDFNGKLSRLIARLGAKVTDRRLGFMFEPAAETSQLDWLNQLAVHLVAGQHGQAGGKGGIKIIDFSEVPSDVLPLVVSLVASLVFELQQWQPETSRLPIALIADEAHLYLPDRDADAADVVALRIFEQIAKQGRKFGTSLVVVTQRPADVNRTVLSQCSNVVAMRLTNAEDQAVIRRLLPDSLGGLADALPLLDTGEAIVVGDAILLPSRVQLAPPTTRPTSANLPVWRHWGDTGRRPDLSAAVEAWRRQSRTP